MPRYYAMLLVPLSMLSALEGQAAPGPAGRPPAKPAAATSAPPALDWRDVTTWGVEGRAWRAPPHAFHGAAGPGYAPKRGRADIRPSRPAPAVRYANPRPAPEVRRAGPPAAPGRGEGTRAPHTEGRSPAPGPAIRSGEKGRPRPRGNPRLSPRRKRRESPRRRPAFVCHWTGRLLALVVAAWTLQSRFFP